MCGRTRGTKLKTLLFLMVMASGLLAQERKVDPTWLHRYVPEISESGGDLSSASCHYKAIFGEGDKGNGILRSMTRFSEITLYAHGSCQDRLFDREEEIYFVLQGEAVLHYGAGTNAMKANDFVYLPPGLKHSLANLSEQPLRVLVIGCKIPSSVSISSPAQQPKIVNLNDVKEETVGGHPTSVLYKLLLGPRTAKRDAIDEAYVVTSFFWMDFAPGGTNF